MIIHNRFRPLLLLSTLIALLAAFTSLAGIVRPALYMPFTPEKLLPGTVSQDIVTFLAALGLLASNWAIHRRIQRAWLLWVALLGYLFYAYALYSFDHIYNPLYLLYSALTGLALHSLIFFFVWLDPDTVVRLDLAKTPRLAIAVYLLMLVAMFVTVWLSLIIPGIQAQQPPDGATIFVIDLAFVLPLLAIVAVMLIRHQPMGALLAPTVLIKVATLDCSVLLGTLIAPFFSQSLDWGSVGVYAVMGLGSAALAIFVLMHVDLGEHADGNIRWMCVRSNGHMLNGRIEQRDLGHLQAVISRKMQISHKHRAGLSVRTRLF